MEPNTHETEIYDVGVEEGRARVTALSSDVKSATATATTGDQVIAASHMLVPSYY